MKHSTNRTRIFAILLWVAAVLTVLVTFSPVILHPGKKDPTILSLPYSLWAGILTTIVLVLLTYLSSRIRDKY